MALSSGFIALAVVGWPTFHVPWSGVPGPVMLCCGMIMFAVGVLTFGHAAGRLATASVTGRIDDHGIY